MLFDLLDYIANLGTITGKETDRLLDTIDTIDTMSPSLNFQKQAARQAASRR